VVAAALVNGGAIGGIAVFVAVMLGGLIGYRRLRVDTPTAR
jgi:ABC-type dipeptide/oligopeptide/nickel transport system permease subunit